MRLLIDNVEIGVNHAPWFLYVNMRLNSYLELNFFQDNESCARVILCSSLAYENTTETLLCCILLE